MIMTKKNNLSLSRGFTLIELLVALTVIAVLVALGLNSYQGARKVARDSKRKADLEQIRSALEIYRTDCRTYPASVTPGGKLDGSGICAGNTYMDPVPNDPISTYTYGYSSSGANVYALCASLEVGSPAAATGCGGGCGAGTCNYKVTNP